MHRLYPTGSIHFGGDPHGRFEGIIHAANTHEPHAVILLGDMDLERPLHEEIEPVVATTDVWWIPGNHDFESAELYSHLFDSSLSSRNLHGRVVEIGGLRVAGLGGVFTASTWDPKVGPGTPMYHSREDFLKTMGQGNRWRGGLPRRRRQAIWPEDYEALCEQRADVLVTHEAPTTHEHGYKEIDELARAMGVQLIVHGHHHRTYIAEMDGIIVYGVGMAAVVDLTGTVIEPGLPDDAASAAPTGH